MTTPPIMTSEQWTTPMNTRQLDDAVRILHDGVRGYSTAADEISNTILATRMRELAKSREEVLGHLMSVAADESNVTPQEDGGTITGALHRGWMKVKSAVAGDEAIIEAAKTGESEAIDRLREVLEEDIDPAIEASIRKAMLDIESATEQLDGMTS